jgi:hypothetical protein
MEKRKIYAAEHVRENDNKLVAFCLFMLQEVGRPRFSIFGVLGWVFAIFAATLGVAMLLNSTIPLWVVLGAAVLIAIPAVIGAAIRDHRLRNE